jgi:hypothetical protein
VRANAAKANARRNAAGFRGQEHAGQNLVVVHARQLGAGVGDRVHEVDVGELCQRGDVRKVVIDLLCQVGGQRRQRGAQPADAPGGAEPPHPRERVEHSPPAPVDAEQLQIDGRPALHGECDRRRREPAGGDRARGSQRLGDPIPQRLQPRLDLEAPQRLGEGLRDRSRPQNRPGRSPVGDRRNRPALE